MLDSKDDLEAIVQELKDKSDILDVANRFMMAQDAADWDALRDTITPTTTVESKRFGLIEGEDEVVKVCQRALGHYDGIIHVMNNVRIEVTGDTANIHYYAISYHLRKGIEGGDWLTNRGTNTIDAVRTDKGWRIACYRTSKIAWQEGNVNLRVNKNDPATFNG